MDSTEKEFRKAELKRVEEKLKKNAEEKVQLLTVKNYLHLELGMPAVDTQTKSNFIPQSQSPAPEQTDFKKGDFYGLSHAQAANKVLRGSSGALTLDQILKILLDSGYDKVGGENPKRTFYVSLARSNKLVLVASNTFDLAERRPNAKKARKKTVKKKKPKTKATK